jgi:DNA-binding response OmpR family regulator
MTRVLVVEDQRRLAASLRKGLEEEGYDDADRQPHHG